MESLQAKAEERRMEQGWTAENKFSEFASRWIYKFSNLIFPEPFLDGRNGMRRKGDQPETRNRYSTVLM